MVAGVLRGVTGVGRAEGVVVAVGVGVAAFRDGREAAVARGRVARVGRADVAVVADHRRPPLALARLRVAGLDPVAGVVVVAVGVRLAAVRDRRMHAAYPRLAAVGGAGDGVVAVVALEAGPNLALSRLRVAGLRSVAGVGVVAVGVRLATARDRRIHAAARAAVGGLVAAVGRAHAPVVAGRERAGHALPIRRVAGLEAVAELAVVADGDRMVADVLLGVAAVGRAEVVVVAVGVGVAAPGDRREAAVARGRVARVARADVAVVADHRRPRLALARLRVAGLDPVAGVGVLAVGVRGTAIRDRRMHAAGHVVAAVGGADQAVVAVGRGAGHALPSRRVAGRDAVAEQAVVAGDIGRVGARSEPVALVVGTEVPVVGADRAGGRRAECGLVARTVVALGPAHAGVAAAGALPEEQIAGLGPVAEDPIIRAVGIRRAQSLSPGGSPTHHRERHHRDSQRYQRPCPHQPSPHGQTRARRL